MTKRLRLFFYLFIIAFIGILLFNSWRDDYDWALIALFICIGIDGLCLLAFLSVFLFCSLENKKIGRLLDNNQYEELLAFSSKKEKKKKLLLPERMEYYNYLSLNCYLALEDKEHIEEEFNKLGSHSQFGITHYWKACYEFSIGKYENLDELRKKFVDSVDYLKNTSRYSNLAQLLDSLISFSKGNISKAKERLASVNRENISMPASLKAIKIIEEAEITEIKEESQIEENINDKEGENSKKVKF